MDLKANSAEDNVEVVFIDGDMFEAESELPSSASLKAIGSENTVEVCRNLLKES